VDKGNFINKNPKQQTIVSAVYKETSKNGIIRKRIGETDKEQ
jgi:hypothetical protein